MVENSWSDTIGQYSSIHQFVIKLIRLKIDIQYTNQARTVMYSMQWRSDGRTLLPPYPPPVVLYCGPEVLFETCVAMKFVDDDEGGYVFPSSVWLGHGSCQGLRSKFGCWGWGSIWDGGGG